MTIENRGVATGIDEEQNQQVSDPFPPPPQVTESARLNLSRWRHGFEPRWDYQGKRVTAHGPIHRISIISVPRGGADRGRPAAGSRVLGPTECQGQPSAPAN
jgi:hypothetical protein